MGFFAYEEINIFKEVFEINGVRKKINGEP
jgi:hypothetical protein